MKIKITAIVIIGLSFGIKAQNTFPTNGNVGIGTNSPSQKFEIYNQNLFNSNMEAQNQDHITFSSINGGNGSFFGGITWKTGSRRRAAIVAAQEHSDSDYLGIAFFTKGTDGPGPIYESMRLAHNGNLGIGTLNPGTWKLAVNGKIRAKEIKVETGWSDFVFENDYKLPTLKEVEKHIKENGHLKDIPSAKEVKKNGIFLGEMDSKLLQKIEELTLYTIQQEKRLDNLESKNKKLEEENKALKTLNSKLLELQKRLEKLEKAKK